MTEVQIRFLYFRLENWAMLSLSLRLAHWTWLLELEETRLRLAFTRGSFLKKCVKLFLHRFLSLWPFKLGIELLWAFEGTTTNKTKTNKQTKQEQEASARQMFQARADFPWWYNDSSEESPENGKFAAFYSVFETQTRKVFIDSKDVLDVELNVFLERVGHLCVLQWIWISTWGLEMVGELTWLKK